MLVIESRADPAAAATESLVLPFEARRKSRLRTRLESGEEAGYFLPPGSALRHGDKLLGKDGRVVEVVAAPEALLEVRAADATELARAAYHLGNRHVAMQVGVEGGGGWLRLVPDPVLREMLLGLGCAVRELVAPFEPEAGAYGHGHRHGAAENAETGQPRIHEYRRP